MEQAQPSPHVPPAPLRWLLLGVFVAAELVYAPGLWNGFAWDDHYLVVENEAVHGFDHAASFFTEPWAGGTGSVHYQKQNALFWRPLTQASYALDWVIGGGDPLWFHVTSNILHGLASVLVALLGFVYAGRLFPRFGLRARLVAGGLAGLLFAVHPVHTEAVNLATYRTTLIASLGVLSALALFERASRMAPALGALCFALGLLGKEDAIVLPGLLVVVDVALGRHRNGAAWLARRYAAVVAVAVLYLVLHSRIARGASLDYFEGATGYETLCTMMKVYLLDVRLLLVPYPLTPFYDWTVVPIIGTLADPEASAGLLLLLFTVAGWLAAFRRGAGAFVLCLGWLIAALVPYSHVLPFADVAGERFLYLPSVALCLGAGIAAGAALHGRYRPRAVLALSAVVAGVYAGMTLARTPCFDSSLALLEASAEAVPHSFNAHYGLGQERARLGDDEGAVASLRRAHAILPDLESAGVSLAMALHRAGRHHEAAQFLAGEIRRRGNGAPDSYHVLLWRYAGERR